MRAHNGMRPQDIVILLKIISLREHYWQYRDLSMELTISISEIAESLNRSFIAGLIDESRKTVFRNSLMEFVQYGLRYVFPRIPGSIVTGMPTAHSHPDFQKYFMSDVNYVWADENGSTRGQSIEPLHKGVVRACRTDEGLYKMLAAIDMIRIGKNREVILAIDILNRYILNESEN